VMGTQQAALVERFHLAASARSQTCYGPRGLQPPPALAASSPAARLVSRQREVQRGENSRSRGRTGRQPSLSLASPHRNPGSARSPPQTALPPARLPVRNGAPASLRSCSPPALAAQTEQPQLPAPGSTGREQPSGLTRPMSGEDRGPLVTAFLT